MGFLLLGIAMFLSGTVQHFEIVEWITLTFCADIHGPRRINPTHFSDPAALYCHL